MDFSLIKTAIAAQFNLMQQPPHQLFRVDIDKGLLWDTYLTSFPDGSNPIYRERTEHDCSCCKSFIRTVGDVVAVVDGRLVSVWDVQISEPAYQAVTTALSQLVLSRPILAPFLHYERTAGTDRNFEQVTGVSATGDDPNPSLLSVKTWTHFHVNINPRFLKDKAVIPTLLGESRSQHDVFLRSLREITDDAIDTVLDLIAQGSLYRGEEHRPLVLQFQSLRQRFKALPNPSAEDLFAWEAVTATGASGAVSRIRNTVIGTLLTDLSNGEDLEGSVRAFESKVAPTNYKRPSAQVTRAMIDKAKQKVEELGLTSALERRYATIADISINNILFADRATRRAITSTGVFDDLADNIASTVNPKTLDRVEEVPIDRFVTEILPRVETLEILVENRHQGNLVSLIAPSDPTARPLFKWRNNFSWSYIGEMADSIRERVKQAGGNVTGDLCCRLAWHNFDDLDLHMREPDGFEIYFAAKRSAISAGQLDVDMNAGSGHTREPVENIFYGDRNRMREGLYHLFVHQYCARETADPGFECEIDYLGTVHQFSYDKPVRLGEHITVAKFHYTKLGGLEIIESLPSTQAQRSIWGLTTQTFNRVNTLMLSPNYWDGDNSAQGSHGIGNRHYLFMLDGCVNDGSARGFFNEFLSEPLTPHRKVFEVVGARMKPAESANQLSGLGFSSTQRNTLVCRVKGSFTRTIKITF